MLVLELSCFFGAHPHIKRSPNIFVSGLWLQWIQSDGVQQLYLYFNNILKFYATIAAAVSGRCTVLHGGTIAQIDQ